MNNDTSGYGGKLNLGTAFHGASQHLRTVRDLVRFAVSRFNEAGLAYGHGSETALDEAVYLVCHGLSLPLDQAGTFLDARLLPAETDQVLQLLQRRVIERRPAAYLTHEAWIGPYRFYVDERVIVPRSYIGHWLAGDISHWIPEPDGIADVLELCTGSGCLAIVLAQVLPAAHIDAVDISPAALEVARRNVADYSLDERVRLLDGDLFAALGDGAQYDLIVSNPPYVTEQAMAALPGEYRHEPRLALAGGEDGLDLVRRILARAAAFLAPHGLLVMEVGHARETVETAFPVTPFTWLEIDGADDAVFVLRRGELPSVDDLV
jgi:ribosomal protein L3 glutamine methyltransferase